MKRLYNIIFPIWFILIMPPIVLLVIPSNFIIDSIVLILGFKFLKLTGWFDKYKNSILKVWIIGFIVDIFGSLLLLMTQFMGSSGYLYDNLIHPLAWNPFSSVLAFFYVLVVVLICGFLIYFINYKFSFKKTDLENKSKKIIAILLGVVTAPYLFFLPTAYFYNSASNGLDKYQDSYIGDNSAVGGIISDIYSGKYLDSFSLDTKSEPYGVTIKYKDGTYGDIYKDLEKDASILFKLVKNVSYVEFKVGTKDYRFDSDYINTIYEDIKSKSLDDIYDRYDNEYFSKFNYLGHLNGYDLFDTSVTCGINRESIYSDDEYNYFVECSDIDSLYLVDNSNKIKLKTALTKKTIDVNDLFKTSLKIDKETKK